MKFIKLTLNNGNFTFINMEHVYEMRREETGGTVLYILAGGGDSVRVKESINDIISDC